MHHTIEQGFSMRLLNIAKPYTRRLTIGALGLCFAMVAACGSDNKGNQAAADSAPVMSDAEAVALSKVALATFPQLPIDILKTAQHYNEPYQTTNPEMSTSDYLRSSVPLQKSAAPAPVPTQIKSCTEGGVAEFKSEHDSNKEDVINSYFKADINFIDCLTHNRSTASVTQNGSALLYLSLVADAETEAPTAADMVIRFQDYSHSQVTDNTSSFALVDGEFGESFFTNSAHETTKMFAATGTINTTATTTSLVTYDRFGLVFEHSEQQDLVYIYGNVIADMENAQYRYSLSTIEPMGTVNGIVQGSFLLESGGSKLFIDRINTEEVTLSADYDDDGSIDYSTVIALPLEDFITANHFSSLSF